MKLRRRQIHMDFHTSPAIPAVGSRFDAEAFAETLARANVNSVTCFAKCHHGMFYYPSKVGPMHPGLRFDLLGRMIRACHRRDILVPAYVSVQWDEHAARAHPEWRVVTTEGQLPGPLIGEAPGGSWPTLCICSGYREYLADTVTELLKRYDVDGVFFDICMDQESCSEPAMAKMRSADFDPNDAGDRARFGRTELIAFLREFYSLVHRLRRGLPVFFNGRVNVGMRDSLPFLTHVEVESLPSGGWGYDHFQRMGRYVRRLSEKPFLGMTARFHKSWADFGTLKNTAALEYEVLSAIAHGGGASIGDQLHPRGQLETATYEQIGAVYAKVRDLEPYCDGAKAVTQIGVISLRTNPDVDADDAVVSDRGATAMLGQTHHLFDLLDLESSLEDYGLIILPDRIAPEGGFVRRLRAYLKRGGRVLVTGRSLLDEAAGRFALPQLKIRYLSPLDYCPFYVRLRKDLGADLPAIDHCMYESGLRVRADRSARTLANVVVPYFNRTAEHYNSHFQTPPAKMTRDPAVVLTRQTAYLNAPFFAAYARHGNLIYRQMVAACIDRILPERIIRTSLPGSGEVSVMDQRRGRRLRRIVHLLHYPPTRRAGDLEIIEEALPLTDVAVDLQAPGRVESIECVPAGEPVPFEQAGHRVRFIVPRVVGHQAICVSMTASAS